MQDPPHIYLTVQDDGSLHLSPTICPECGQEIQVFLHPTKMSVISQHHLNYAYGTLIFFLNLKITNKIKNESFNTRHFCTDYRTKKSFDNLIG